MYLLKLEIFLRSAESLNFSTAEKHLAAYSSLAMLGMTAFGVLLSVYLTALEPFVISATCAWCLTPAIIMTALFLPACYVLTGIM